MAPCLVVSLGPFSIVEASLVVMVAVQERRNTSEVFLHYFHGPPASHITNLLISGAAMIGKDCSYA
jgi:hypothetical protein